MDEHHPRHLVVKNFPGTIYFSTFSGSRPLSLPRCCFVRIFFSPTFLFALYYYVRLFKSTPLFVTLARFYARNVMDQSPKRNKYWTILRRKEQKKQKKLDTQRYSGRRKRSTLVAFLLLLLLLF